MTAGRGLGPTIAEAMRRPHNNFTALRLALALAVIVSHAFSITTGSLENEPLMRSTGFTLGEHAVNGFFAVSGFLVTMSFDRRGWRDYVVARALRIVPALVAATLVTALLLGPALTRLPLAQYLADPALWRFIALTPTTFKSATALPGLFSDNVFPYPMGTVWTLKYEMLCYIGVFAAGLAGLMRQRIVALGLVAALFVAIVALDLLHPEAGKATQTSLRLPFLFAAGGVLYLWSDKLPVSSIVAARSPRGDVARGRHAALQGTALRLRELRRDLARACAGLVAPGPRASRRPVLRHLSLWLARAAGARATLSGRGGAFAPAAGGRDLAHRRRPVLVRRREAGAQPEGASRAGAGARRIASAGGVRRLPPDGADGVDELRGARALQERDQALDLVARQLPPCARDERRDRRIVEAHAQRLRRIAGDDRVGRHVPRHHRLRADHRAVADRARPTGRPRPSRSTRRCRS